MKNESKPTSALESRIDELEYKLTSTQVKAKKYKDALERSKNISQDEGRLYSNATQEVKLICIMS